MKRTVTEKILSRASGRDALAGSIVEARVDFLMTNDAVGELVVRAFEQLHKPVWDARKTAIMIDHFFPASTEDAARVHALLRAFAAKHGIALHDGEGVCHQIMVERYVKPGMVVVGTDSHTCTYGALGAFATGIGSTEAAGVLATGALWFKVPESIRVNFSGALPQHVHAKDAVLHLLGTLKADGAIYKALEFGDCKALGIAERMTVCNMAIEAGAKNGIFEGKTSADSGAEYERVMGIALGSLEPQVACPYSVDNVKPVAEVAGTRIEQAFAGSCTNGRIEDLRVIAKVLKGRRVAKHVRFLIAPASRSVLGAALDEGLIRTFLDAGAVMLNPNCSACFGGQGMLAAGEACIGTHNRNFRGRMGHKDAKIYLASPETVAASAVKGEITDPRKFR